MMIRFKGPNGKDYLLNSCWIESYDPVVQEITTISGEEYHCNEPIDEVQEKINDALVGDYGCEEYFGADFTDQTPNTR